MISEQLEIGQKVLHDNVGIAKTVFDTIYMMDEQQYLVLFTDNTYAIVPLSFVWSVFSE